MADYFQAVINGLFAGLGLGIAEWIKERKTKNFLDRIDQKIKETFKK